MADRLGRWTAPLLAALLALALAPLAPADDGVDPAAKQLIAANGLFQRGMFKEAAEEYTGFLHDHPNHDQAQSARYALAICDFRLEKFDDASAILTELVKDARFDQRDEALAVLGHCALSSNHPDKALAWFDALIDQFPKSKQAELASLNRAQALYLLKRNPDCVAACRAFLKDRPESEYASAAQYFLALAQHAAGDEDEAQKSVTALLSNYPNSPYQVDAMLVAAQSMEAQGRLDAAAEQYVQILKAAPAVRQDEFHYALGCALHKAAKYPAAIEQLQAVADDPRSAYAVAARLQLGLSELASERIADARANLAKVADADAGKAPLARYWLAQCDIAENKPASAKAALEALAKLQPPPVAPAQLAFDHALCVMLSADYAPAAEEFAALRKANPNFARANDAAFREAYCLHKLGKWDQSHALCAALDPSDARVMASAAPLDAENLFLLQKYPEARTRFAALAKEGGPEQLRYRVREGESAYFAGDFDGAIAALSPMAHEEKLAADPALSRAILLLGDALLQKGRARDAVDVLSGYAAREGAEQSEAQYRLAMAREKDGDVDGALRGLAAMVEKPAASIWVQRGLVEYGQLAYKAQQRDKARAALDKALAAGLPSDLAARALYWTAWIDLDEGHAKEAAAGFARVAKDYSKDPLAADAAYQQGFALNSAGDLSNAVDILKSYVDQNPTGEHAQSARRLIASSMNKLGKPDEAIKTLAAYAADPKTVSDQVLYDLAWAYRGAKDNAKAGESYERLIDAYAKSKLATPARAELADLLYEKGQFAPAVKLLDTALGDTGAEPSTLAAAQYRLGLCEEKLNHPEKAAAAFAAYVEKHPKEALVPWALYEQGVNEAAAGKSPAARKSYEAVIARFADHDAAADAQLKLGELENQLGDYEAAATTFDAFIRTRPTHDHIPAAHFGMGWSFENQKRYADARAHYAKTVAMSNAVVAAQAQFQIGETYIAERDYDAALKALLAVEDVYSYVPWRARAAYEAARVLEQMKKPDLAQKQYRHVAETYKDAPEAQLAADRLRALARSE